jgi:hypothetical protein
MFLCSPIRIIRFYINWAHRNRGVKLGVACLTRLEDTNVRLFHLGPPSQKAQYIMYVHNAQQHIETRFVHVVGQSHVRYRHCEAQTWYFPGTAGKSVPILDRQGLHSGYTREVASRNSVPHLRHFKWNFFHRDNLKATASAVRLSYNAAAGPWNNILPSWDELQESPYSYKMEISLTLRLSHFPSLALHALGMRKLYLHIHGSVATKHKAKRENKINITKICYEVIDCIHLARSENLYSNMASTRNTTAISVGETGENSHSLHRFVLFSNMSAYIFTVIYFT